MQQVLHSSNGAGGGGSPHGQDTRPLRTLVMLQCWPEHFCSTSWKPNSKSLFSCSSRQRLDLRFWMGPPYKPGWRVESEGVEATRGDLGSLRLAAGGGWDSLCVQMPPRLRKVWGQHSHEASGSPFRMCGVFPETTLVPRLSSRSPSSLLGQRHPTPMSVYLAGVWMLV